MAGRCCVHGGVLRGVESILVDVEVAVSSGIPGFYIVGMVDAAVQESRERVRAAIRAAGFSMPADRVLVNLAPSSLKKSGSGFDLPIAVGILVATGQIDPAIAKNVLFVGELSLDGTVRPVNGLLAYALCARDYGYVFVCSDEAGGLVRIEGLRQFGLEALSSLRQPSFTSFQGRFELGSGEAPDFKEVSGNEVAKRALQIAAAGHHGILMMGPPGSGKTMLASRMPSILPTLDEEERLEVALIQSVAGEGISGALAGHRPFRAPHHSATAAGLIGGGSPVKPGEISLAHKGILFLDELPEFRPSVLQQLRQPIEAGQVCITRADGNVVFPCEFMLVAAANPCRCGFFGDEDHACTCSAKQVHDYQNRIGGPLIDRIDMHIDVKRVPPHSVLAREEGTSSEQLKAGVLKARDFKSWRQAREGRDGAKPGIIESCRLSDADSDFFEKAAVSNGMSGRAIVRVLSVARTIADMEERDAVTKSDLCEALSFRLREGAGK